MLDPRLRLHRARVERGIDLNRITALTALSPMVVRKIDEGRFEDLPGGVYARSYIRAFAETVGLRGDDALHEVEGLLPGAPDPLPTLREKSHPTWLDAIRTAAAARLQRLPGTDALLKRLPTLPPLRRPGVGRALAARLEPVTRMSGLRQRVPSRPLLGAAGRRASAALVDAVLLLIVGAALIGLTAMVADVTIATLLEDAGAAVAIACSIPIALYFLLFEGIAGQTPGGAICGYRKGAAAALPSEPDSAPSRRALPHYASERPVVDDTLEVCFESEARGFERAATATDR